MFALLPPASLPGSRIERLPAVLDILTPYIKVVIEALATAAASYLVLWLKRVSEKAGLHVSAEKFTQLQAEAAQAIAAVTEEALQAKAGGAPMSHTSKLSRAVEMVLTKLPGTPEDQIEVAIHALLPKLGEGLQAPKAAS